MGLKSPAETLKKTFEVKNAGKPDVLRASKMAVCSVRLSIATNSRPFFSQNVFPYVGMICKTSITHKRTIFVFLMPNQLIADNVALTAQSQLRVS